MKRDLFSELREGFEALEEQREGKLKLVTYQLERPEGPIIKESLLRDLLSKLISGQDFRLSQQTLENYIADINGVP